MHKAAEINGPYRYNLWRIWDKEKPLMNWIMLNPSTADAEIDDPTIRKCKGFAERHRFGGIWVVNLFALRATNPKDLKLSEDPVGANDLVLKNLKLNLSPEDMTVLAWGCHGKLNGRDQEVLDMIGPYNFCLGQNKDGTPKHPLYVPYSKPLVVFHR